MKKLLVVFLAVLFACGIAFAEGGSGTVKVGDYITFGRYEQDNDLENGPEEIEWLVVEAEEGKCCLVSRYILDAQNFHNTEEAVTWETCWLRGWLNEEFLNTAFSAEEQELIPVTHVDNSIQSPWTKSPNDTDDRIYLLSYSEVYGKYFRKDWDRYCLGTPYAIARGLQSVRQRDGSVTSGYWLRVGHLNIDYFTSVQPNGRECNTSHGAWLNGVRPVLWMKLGQ